MAKKKAETTTTPEATESKQLAELSAMVEAQQAEISSLEGKLESANAIIEELMSRNTVLAENKKTGKALITVGRKTYELKIKRSVINYKHNATVVSEETLSADAELAQHCVSIGLLKEVTK